MVLIKLYYILIEIIELKNIIVFQLIEKAMEI